MGQVVSIELAMGLGMAHHRAGRLGEAEGVYLSIVQQGEHADALDHLGVIALQRKNLQTAEAYFRRAVQAGRATHHGQCAGEHLANLGESLRRLERFEEALELLTEARDLLPDQSKVHNNLGLTLSSLDRLDDALVSLQRAVQLDDHYADAHSHLGCVLGKLRQRDDAVIACRQAVELSRTNPEHWNNYGVALASDGQTTAAIDAYCTAIGMDSQYAEPCTNLGNALGAIGQCRQSVAACARGVSLAPESVHAHWNYAIALLRAGDFKQGWIEHEWRYRFDPETLSRHLPIVRWRGEDLSGKSIIVYGEQGFGDTLHFCRYVSMVASRGGRVIFQCQDALWPLLKEMPGADRVIPFSQTLDESPDYQVPLMSLPMVFGTLLETVPDSMPYLRVPGDLLEQWNQKIQPYRTRPDGQRRLQVGLVWAGNPLHTNDKNRSVTLEMLAPLAASGAMFHSIQKGPTSGMGAHPPAGMDLADHSASLTDYAQTAAIVSQMDLMITVDTSVAHLSGALGKPIGVLLPRPAEWRWLGDQGQTNPWYPTMRLFRQPTRGDWSSPIADLAEALKSQAMSCNQTVLK